MTTTTTAYGEKLWTPSPARIESARITSFSRAAERLAGRSLPDYDSLYRWSLEAPGAFWSLVAHETHVVWQTRSQKPYSPPPAGKMRGAVWFEGARLNYAENLLARLPADAPAVIALAEGAARRELSAAELRARVARCAAALRRAGVGPGDRVAGVVANVPEALIAMLGAATLGAIWSSCSPDFGVAAVVDRLRQVEPKIVFYTERYVYGGKAFAGGAALSSALSELPGVTQTVGVDHFRADGGAAFASFLASAAEDPAPAFTPLPFDAPLFILFSSGTTGVPKCITHGVGGTLLQHAKELVLHGDVGPSSRLLYYTTCGWMMWNWMVSALATGATLVLFEGSVATPDLGVLWRAVAAERVTHFGTSPKFMGACMGAAVSPRSLLGAKAPSTVFSTGSPLLPEHCAWIYDEIPDVHLASISGGTDIVSCFMLGVPTLPVRSGEIQARGLGMAVFAWDDEGHEVLGQKGELVCTRPFPSMPVCFWSDPDGARYDAAYFAHFRELRPDAPEAWRHGDFIEITGAGGIVVYGRSDATLNPGGVRIGTAELYRQIEREPAVADSIAVAERDAHGDECIILFVKLKPGIIFDATVEKTIKDGIRKALTPRHVPKRVVAVEDVPYTRSGKKVEIAVTQAIHGEEIKSLAAIANPECMAAFHAYFRSRT